MRSRPTRVDVTSGTPTSSAHWSSPTPCSPTSPRRAGLGGADGWRGRRRGSRLHRHQEGASARRPRGGGARPGRHGRQRPTRHRRRRRGTRRRRPGGNPGVRRAAADRPHSRLAGSRGRGGRGRAPPEVPHRRRRGAPVPAAATVAAWIDAALDRETPYKCTAGLHHAVRHRDHETGFEHLGFLNVLLATRVAFDGGSREDVAQVLDDHYANDLVAMARQSDLAGARRWFTSFGSCSIDEPLEELVGLGLMEAPRE